MKGAIITRQMCAIRRCFRMTWRLGFLGVFFTMLNAQQSRLGPMDVVRSGPNELEIRRGAKLWRVDLSQLIRKNDCAVLGDSPCPDRPTSPCPDCPKRVAYIAWDERYGRLYFAIGTGQSKNIPWTVFAYSITTHRVARFMNTWSADLRDGVVSRSGRYLAYVNLDHGGVCTNSDTIEVIDLWDRRLATLSTESSAIDTISGLRHPPQSCTSRVRLKLSPTA